MGKSLFALSIMERFFPAQFWWSYLLSKPLPQTALFWKLFLPSLAGIKGNILRVSQQKPNKFFISGTHNESDFGLNQQQQPTIFVNEDPDIDQIRIGTPPAIIELE